MEETSTKTAFSKFYIDRFLFILENKQEIFYT